MLKSLLTERNSFRIGRVIASLLAIVIASIVVVICLGVLLLFFQVLTVIPQWEWGQIKPSQKFSSSSVSIDFVDCDKKEARFRLTSNNPARFPCWLWFQMEHKRTKNFAVNHTWFPKIRYRLQKDTQDAQLAEELILHVRTLSNASSLPFDLSLVYVPDIPKPSLLEAFFGQNKSFEGDITILMAVPQSIVDDSDLHSPSNTWLPIRAFDYVVECEPSIGFR